MAGNRATTDIAQRLGAVHANLRSDLEVTRHVFRQRPCYVVRDPMTFQSHQFSQQDYSILIALNDSVSLGEIFTTLVRQGKLFADQEEDFYHFVLNLHQLGHLSLPIADAKVLYQRYAARRRVARWQHATGFLFLRVPLINPDAFLDRTIHLVKPLFTRAAFCVWLAMMFIGLGLVFQRWDAFRNPLHSILANDTLIFLWAALIGLKVFHEFGHAYACKRFGGNVPEMGAYFIAFTPCAYVDASSAWGFDSRRQRIVVSLAGMYFESIIAVLAVIVWNWTDNPLIGSWAHHIFVLASVVTIGFNINPLMRYDGYYIFSDLVGIPNLRQRGMEQVQTLLKRVFLGIPIPASEDSRKLRLLLFIFGVASVMYKVTIVLAICAMIAMKFYLIGVGLAAMFIVTVVGGGVYRLLHYLWRSEETRQLRLRAVGLSMALLILAPGLLFAVRIPGSVVISGVVQTEADKVIRAAAHGFVRDVPVTLGTRVRQGDPVCHLDNQTAEAEVHEAEARVRVLELRYRNALAMEPLAATVAQFHVMQARQQLEETRQERDALRIDAPISGLVTRVLDARDTGRFIKKGEAVATIAAGPWVVRCLATAQEMTDIQPVTGMPVRARVTADGIREITGTLTDVAVKGSRKVFSPALTQLAGGQIVVHPASLEAARPLFELVIRLDDIDGIHLKHDARAAVRFNSAPQSYGAYFHRRFRQFLNKLRMR